MEGNTLINEFRQLQRDFGDEIAIAALEVTVDGSLPSQFSGYKYSLYIVKVGGYNCLFPSAYAINSMNLDFTLYAGPVSDYTSLALLFDFLKQLGVNPEKITGTEKPLPFDPAYTFKLLVFLCVITRRKFFFTEQILKNCINIKIDAFRANESRFKAGVVSLNPFRPTTKGKNKKATTVAPVKSKASFDPTTQATLVEYVAIGDIFKSELAQEAFVASIRNPLLHAASNAVVKEYINESKMLSTQIENITHDVEARKIARSIGPRVTPLADKKANALLDYAFSMKRTAFLRLLLLREDIHDETKRQALILLDAAVALEQIPEGSRGQESIYLYPHYPRINQNARELWVELIADVNDEDHDPSHPILGEAAYREPGADANANRNNASNRRTVTVTNEGISDADLLNRQRLRNLNDINNQNVVT